MTRTLKTHFPLLQNQDLEPTIDLHAVLDCVYDRAGFEVAIDYTQAPIPALNADDRAWCENLLISQIS